MIARKHSFTLSSKESIYAIDKGGDKRNMYIQTLCVIINTLKKNE